MDMNIEARDPNNHIKYAKRMAAYKAVDDNVCDGMRIGIGSGSTVVYVVKRLEQLYNEDKIDEIICVPTSFQSEQLLINANLSIGTLNQFPLLDLTIDGADEIDCNLNCIKGGGGCALQEKIIASNSKKLIIVADYRKVSTTLGQNWKKGLPIEVLPKAWVSIKHKIEQLGGKAKLRMSLCKAGPVVTDSNNFILDVNFGLIDNPSSLEISLIKIPGIIETGLFINMSCMSYIGNRDGTVDIQLKTF